MSWSFLVTRCFYWCQRIWPYDLSHLRNWPSFGAFVMASQTQFDFSLHLYWKYHFNAFYKIWSYFSVSFLISIPFALYHEEKNDMKKLYCVPDWGDQERDKLVSLIVIFTTYVNPLGIIVICYTQILRNLWTGNRHSYMPSIRTEVILLNIPRACSLVNLSFYFFFFLFFCLLILFSKHFNFCIDISELRKPWRDMGIFKKKPY